MDQWSVPDIVYGSTAVTVRSIMRKHSTNHEHNHRSAL